MEQPADDEKKDEEPEEPPFRPNDFLQKAEMEPPHDPMGNPSLCADLTISVERIVEILDANLQKALTWIMTEKQLYEQKVSQEVMDLQDKSVEELDENLRKQWPRKGRLEVEIFQQRKGEITAHNKKYERHVRAQLEKHNDLETEWEFVIEGLTKEFEAFKERHEKMKNNLQDGKNLAELQGMSRREKDTNQIFVEKVEEFNDQMFDLGEARPETYIK